jgi:hypothetical protein
MYVVNSWQYSDIPSPSAPDIKQIHNYKMQIKLDLHVQFCNMDLFRSVVNMGIRLHNKVPDHIKKLEKNCLRERWDPFCCNMHFIQWTNLYHTDCMSIV